MDYWPLPLNDITPQTPLIDSIFRVFLKNNNTPQSPRELARIIDRPAATILKAIGGFKIYKGLRPVLQES